MGWVMYALNTKAKVAIALNRHNDYDDYSETTSEDIIDLFEQLCEPKIKEDVIKYIMSKHSLWIHNSDALLWVLLKDKGFSKVVHEDKLPKGYKVINE